MKYRERRKHPELRSGEVFYTNAPDKYESEMRSDFKTLRKGRICYDISGSELKDSECFPWFISEEEAEKER
jgi:hypothetical protein